MKHNEFPIIYEPKPTPEDVRVLTNGLSDYARQQKGMDPIESFTFLLKIKKVKYWLVVEAPLSMVVYIQEVYGFQSLFDIKV